KTDTPIDVPLEDFELHAQDGPKLVAFLKAMEFTSLTRRVAAATETDADAVEAASVPVEWGAQAHGPDLDKGELSSPPPPSALSTANSPARGTAAQAATALAALAGSGADAATPQALAQSRAALFATAKIDRSAYVTIRDVATLDQWIADARETGLVGFDTETTSLDAMQAELCGFSLAIADNARDPSGVSIRAAYVPLLHKSGVCDLLGGGMVERQITMGDELSRLKARLEDASVLNVTQNLKYDYLVMKRHGITMQGFDDTMLMSYALDAGAGTHGMDSLSE